MTVLLAACDLALLLGATLRTVRLVVADDFPGTWLLREPAQRWAISHEPTDVSPARHARMETSLEWEPSWRGKLVEGLSCPFCIGLWIAAVMVLILAAVGGPGHAPDWWRIGAGILTLNWVAAHVGVRAGDTED
jgi:hypothetical protein